MAAPATTAARRGISGPRLVGAAFLLSTVINFAFEVGDIVFTDRDPHRSEGPIESIQGIAVYGGIGLVVALAVALPLAKDPAKAKIGAIALGALSLVTLPFFWSGAPASLGAAAAWLAGISKGTQPQTGIARGFGVVGLVVAAMVIVATLAGHLTMLLSAFA